MVGLPACQPACLCAALHTTATAVPRTHTQAQAPQLSSPRGRNLLRCSLPPRCRWPLLLLPHLQDFLAGFWGTIAAGRDHTPAPGDHSLAAELLRYLEPRGSGGGEPLMEHRQAAEAGALLLAGMQHLAHALSWALYALAANPAVQDKLLAELQAANIVRDPISFSHDSLAKLPYLQAVVRETLRLYPPGASGTVRTLQRDTLLGGHLVPAGTDVWVHTYALHTSSALWADPLKFSPERWLPAVASSAKGGSGGGYDGWSTPVTAPPAAGGGGCKDSDAKGGGNGGSAKGVKRKDAAAAPKEPAPPAGSSGGSSSGKSPPAACNMAAYMPFSLGNHSCLGQGLARMHVSAAVALLVSQIQFELVEEAEAYTAEALLSLSPREGVPLRCVLRPHWAEAFPEEAALAQEQVVAAAAKQLMSAVSPAVKKAAGPTAGSGVKPVAAVPPPDAALAAALHTPNSVLAAAAAKNSGSARPSPAKAATAAPSAASPSPAAAAAKAATPSPPPAATAPANGGAKAAASKGAKPTGVSATTPDATAGKQQALQPPPDAASASGNIKNGEDEAKAKAAAEADMASKKSANTAAAEKTPLPSPAPAASLAASASADSSSTRPQPLSSGKKGGKAGGKPSPLGANGSPSAASTPMAPGSPAASSPPSRPAAPILDAALAAAPSPSPTGVSSASKIVVGSLEDAQSEGTSSRAMQPGAEGPAVQEEEEEWQTVAVNRKSAKRLKA